ncbi:Uncharacterised protein [Mycobacterium tuberculosis]|nr:Uncharacterised protein [Mycobacterium tuberculosis]
MRMVGSGRQTQNPERGRKLRRPSLPFPLPTCRQTQNPERGRKPEESEYSGLPSALVVRPKTPRGDGNIRTSSRQRRKSPVVRPKTPRGDGNSTSISLTSPGEKITSSDPKPRERTETRRRSRRCRCPNRRVVRPKTPRGDGNWIALTGLALILVVVRPKTPRGDGNSTSISLTSPGEKITSSDPKPRERTETRRRSRRCRCPNRRVVRPKTPRGDGNLERVTADGTIETSRQTQNPERGRKPSAQHR